MLADKTPTDLSRVSLTEEWEIRWWCNRFGCTEVALRRAVDETGPSAADVERKLQAAGKQSLQNTGED